MDARRVQRAVRRITEWYLRHYHGTRWDLGVPAMFCDPRRLGRMAVSPRDFSRGTPTAVFKILVASTVFQRRQDLQVFRILTGLSETAADGLTNARDLIASAEASRCSCLGSQAALHEECDVYKDPHGRVDCSTHPRLRCPVKKNATLLRRYADFGKVAHSAALMLRDSGHTSFVDLHRVICLRHESRRARATAFAHSLSAVWRVSDKIASMALSVLSNPFLGRPAPPWSSSLDWRSCVVVDSNVEAFFAATGLHLPSSYQDRVAAVRDLARPVRLDRLSSSMAPFNPRLVQQALYMFMSVSNRRAAEVDCSRGAPGTCAQCASDLRRLCPIYGRSPVNPTLA